MDDYLLTMYLLDWDGNKMRFAGVDSIDEGRALWIQFAGIRGVQVDRFELYNKDGKMVYMGHYGTDEC